MSDNNEKPLNDPVRFRIVSIALAVKSMAEHGGYSSDEVVARMKFEVIELRKLMETQATK